MLRHSGGKFVNGLVQTQVNKKPPICDWRFWFVAKQHIAESRKNTRSELDYKPTQVFRQGSDLLRISTFPHPPSTPTRPPIHTFAGLTVVAMSHVTIVSLIYRIAKLHKVSIISPEPCHRIHTFVCYTVGRRVLKNLLFCRSGCRPIGRTRAQRNL
jgi:hypothetical protein